MAIRVILLDIDGTLLNSKKQLLPKTKAALLKAQENGVRLALCSGRTEQGLQGLTRELEMDRHGGLLVCCNGGKVVDCQTGDVLFDQPIPAREAKAVLEHLKQFDVVPMVAHGEYMYVTDVFNHDLLLPERVNIMRYEARGNGYLLCEVRDLAQFVDFGLNKILTYGQPEYLREHYQQMAAPFAGKVNAMFTAPFYFEYTAVGVDKARALTSALTPLGISREETIAFGDAENDLPMLEFAGVGVAMGNAVEAVKAAADEVTASNDDEGIALSLYRHLPELFPREN